jgi:NhaP-type Na+/H+ or K+/H+ antiporter
MLVLVSGIVFATLLGVLSGWGIASAFRRGWVPEYMKVPVLFVTLLAIFAASNLEALGIFAQYDYEKNL